MEIFHISNLISDDISCIFYIDDTHLSGGRETQDEAHGADPQCDGALPGLESGRPDGDDALDDGVEDGEALGDAEEDEDEVEEDGPEGRDHLGSQQGEVGRDELGGEPGHLVAALQHGVPLGRDDPHPGQVTDVVVLGRAGPEHERVSLVTPAGGIVVIVIITCRTL